MIYIEKNEEPQWLKDFKIKNPQANYDAEAFLPFHGKLREELVKEQQFLCAYCCGRVTREKAHNEHIEPRHPKDGVSHKSLDYDNIVASCNRKSSCGNRKGNEFDEKLFISPLDPQCESTFTYYPDGVVEGDAYTISLLNLNDYELKTARKAVYRQLRNLDKNSIEMIYGQQETGELPAFYNVIKWYLNTME